MNCNPEYPEDLDLLKSIHDVGSYGGGGGGSGGCYSLDGQIIKHILSIKPAKKDEEAKFKGQKEQERAKKERSSSSSMFPSPDIEKGPVIVQVQDSRLVKIMACISTLLLLVVVAVVLTMLFNARPSGSVQPTAPELILVSSDDSTAIQTAMERAFIKYKN